MQRVAYRPFRRSAVLLGILAIMLAVAAVLIAHRYGSLVQARGDARPPDSASGAATVATEKKVFESTLPGRWYDADKDKLTAELDGYLAKVDATPLDNVHAIIVPHAGYQYSGQIAAYAYKQIAGKKFGRVIVMGPSHHLPMENVASVPDVTHYATPLGEMPLDVDFIAALKKHGMFRTVRGADVAEHSVQIQLPFLQRALGEFALVPIVVGQLDVGAVREMAKILAGLIDADTLVVASSDFTHYGSDYGYLPFTTDVLENLKKLDMGSWECIEKKDVDAFSQYVEKTGTTICGRCPISVLLAMLPPEMKAHLIKYDTSGNLTHDTAKSVSYLAIGFTGTWKKGEPVAPKVSETASLTDEDKAQLLTLARATLEGYVKNGHAPKPDELGIKITPGMSQIMGAFVTLTEHGELRGCIGEIFPQRALYKAVIAHAVDSGVNDNRFRPVKVDELPLLHYEISALTQPYPVNSYHDIVLGKHGIVIEKNGRTAVFLPQVPGEQGWDLPATLTHLSQKAGMPPDAWQEGASFTVFEAIVFGEKKE
jgi:AmmeMemoRadiSam system protein B/AmmeMemoRadiSam system protein A